MNKEREMKPLCKLQTGDLFVIQSDYLNAFLNYTIIDKQPEDIDNIVLSKVEHYMFIKFCATATEAWCDVYDPVKCKMLTMRSHKSVFLIST